MKKLTFLLAALVSGASLSAQAPAAAPAPAPSYSVTVDFPYTTKYVFRGIQAAKGAFQPSIKVTSGDFYAGIWVSAPVDKGYELEIDYYAGYGSGVLFCRTLNIRVLENCYCSHEKYSWIDSKFAI